MRLLRNWLVALVLTFAIVVVLAPSAVANPDPAIEAAISNLPASCTGMSGTQEAPLSEESPCAVLLAMGMYASPNPAPYGSSVQLVADCGAETDGWDNLGNSWWHSGVFYVTMTASFDWTIYCSGYGVESRTITVACSDCGGGGGGGGGGGSPPPPPTELPQLEGGAFELGASGIENPRNLSGRARCKWQEFKQTYHFLGGVDMLRYEGTFKVCYIPSSRILSVEYIFGDAAWWCCGWWWQGNDQGYPTAENHGDYVTMRWRGTIEFCAYPPVCVGNKHVGVRITFYPNNTLERAWSVD